MTTAINPFITSGYKGPDYFCDREQETRRLITSLQGGSNVTLMAPRRIGKTGLIMHAFHLMQQQEPDAQFFYIDILATKSLDQLTKALASAIAGKVDSPLEKVKNWANDFIKGFRPKMTFDVMTGAPEFSFEIQPSDARHTLESILDYLERSERRCYVAIDEFQQILNYDDTGTEALIRSKVQMMRNTNFVFAGSMMHLMADIFLSPKHPFFHSTSILTLSEIDRDAFREFANRHLAAKQKSISKEDFNYLYDMVDGQTWYVQKILNNIYQQPQPTAGRNAINQAANDAILEQEPTFQYIVFTLSPNQEAVLKAIARDGIVPAPYARDFLQRHHLPAASSVRRTVQNLEAKQLIYHKVKEGYLVYDRFFAIWLRRQV